MFNQRTVLFIIFAFIVLPVGNAVNLNTSDIKNHENHIEDDSQEDDPSWYRLPTYVLPEKYELWLFPQLAVENFTYEGRVKIQLRVERETNSLIVHAVGLEIDRDKSEVREIATSTKILIVKQYLDTKRQMCILSFTNNISPGRYTLSLSFVGEVLDDLNGFYRSSYESAGKRRWLGVTQFSSIFARRAFPCLDEPYMKATYRLHIGHYKNETVTGNTRAESVQEIMSDYVLTTFEETPPMPTYLVGWAIHDFIYTTTSNSTSIVFGLWTRELMKDHGAPVLNECAKIYKVLDEWIQVKNQIPKMDQIAVPDFYWSAMENWGMVTFRESVVLWEDGITPSRKIHSALSTIAHEYAHTWFGNLVTPKFWNVAWLKEGFATFFGHYVVGIVHNDWSMMDLFGVDVLQPALLQDSAQHDRSMNGKNVGSPKSIPACMDFVTYKKGSSIIRMIYHLIGDDAFQRGLQAYITNLAGYYATPADFYHYLQNFTDQKDLPQETVKLSEVVETWTNQPGYPVVTVTRNYTTSIATIAQGKFYLNSSRKVIESDNSRWWIPLNFATVEFGTHEIPKKASMWISSHEQSIVTSIRTTQAILCNIHQAYYYRVNYDSENWHRLISHLKSIKFESIGSVNRASLLDDSFNLAKAGYIDYSIPLELSGYLIQEVDYEPWVAATASFDFLNVMLSDLPDVRRAFQFHVNRVIRPIYEKLSIDKGRSDMRTKLLKNVILSTACSMNNVKCVNSAEDLFKEWLENKTTRINPDAKSSVYCAGTRSANPKEWHEVLRIFLRTELHTEQELLIAGLGCTNNFTLIKEFLSYSLHDGPELRKQYRLAVYDAVLAGDPKNVEHVLKFVHENLKKIVLARDSSFLSNIFEAIKKRIVNDEQLRKLEALVNENADLIGPSMADARTAIEFAKDNIDWIKTYAPKIAQWLI